MPTLATAVAQPKTLPPAPAHAWHWPEYGAEFAGTVWNVFIGLSAVVFNFAPGQPGARLVPDASLRLWLTGLIFAGSGSLFTISPWGRLSGAHINPSVTLAFWTSGKVRWHDLLGYLGAQLLGGACGAGLLAVIWRTPAAALRYGLTGPGPGYSVAVAFGAEALMTFVYLLGIFAFVSRSRLMRWTPLYNWLSVSGLVWLGAGVSGTSLIRRVPSVRRWCPGSGATSGSTGSRRRWAASWRRWFSRSSDASARCSRPSFFTRACTARFSNTAPPVNCRRPIGHGPGPGEMRNHPAI